MTTTEFIKRLTTNVVLLAALQFIARSAGWQPAVLIAIVYAIIVVVAIGNEIAEWRRNKQCKSDEVGIPIIDRNEVMR